MACAFVVSSTVAGATAGGALGIVGGFVARDARVAAASVLAVVAIVIGGLEFTARHLRPPQFDRETAPPWLSADPLLWAIRNGLALGFGGSSRIGFWLWYVVPAGAVLVGDAVFGAALYGGYGLVRGASVWLLILVRRRRSEEDHDLNFAMVSRNDVVRTWAGGVLIAIGLSVVLVIGL